MADTDNAADVTTPTESVVMCNGLWCRDHGPSADEYREALPGADVRSSHCMRACFFPPVMRYEGPERKRTFFSVRGERADQVLQWISGEGEAPSLYPPMPPMPKV